MSKIVMMNYNIKYLSKKSYIIYTLSKIVKYIYFKSLFKSALDIFFVDMFIINSKLLFAFILLYVD